MDYTHRRVNKKKLLTTSNVLYFKEEFKSLSNTLLNLVWWDWTELVRLYATVESFEMAGKGRVPQLS